MLRGRRGESMNDKRGEITRRGSMRHEKVMREKFASLEERERRGVSVDWVKKEVKDIG